MGVQEPESAMTTRGIFPAVAIVAAVLAVSTLASSKETEKKGDGGWTEGDEAAEAGGIEYPGVDPEKMTGIAPLIENAKKSKKTVVTWPGFQMVHGGSRVFVQMVQGTSAQGVTAPVRTAKLPFKVEENSLVYAFDKKVVLVKNNLNPLITRAFNTPVDYVRMKRAKGQVYMVLKLRRSEEPVREELVETEDGYHFFFVEFAAGEYLPKAEGKGSSKKIVE
jgi:hypothetical protein